MDGDDDRSGSPAPQQASDDYGDKQQPQGEAQAAVGLHDQEQTPQQPPLSKNQAKKLAKRQRYEESKQLRKVQRKEQEKEAKAVKQAARKEQYRCGWAGMGGRQG